MSREDPQLKLRLTAEMRDEIRDAALANGRSMNAEIVARLSGQQRTIRDEFAMAALTGLAAGYWVSPSIAGLNPNSTATEAFQLADAMLAAREAQR